MTPGSPIHTAAAFAILAAILLYLHRQYHQRSFLLWGLAWLVLFVRQIAAAAFGAPALASHWLGAVLLAVGGALILFGGFGYAGPARLGALRSAAIGIALGALTVLALTALLEFGPPASRPVTLAVAFLGVSAMGAGWLLGRHERASARVGARLSAAALLVWGGLQPVAWVAAADGSAPAWLAVLESVLAILLAVGLIVLGIETTRSGLVEGRVDPRDLFDEDPNMILVVQEGHYVFANRAFRERSGWRLEDIEGDDLFEHVAPEHREQAVARFEARLRGESVGDYELEFFDARGSRVPVIVHATPISWDGGTALRYVLTDITTRRRAEAEIHAINAELQRINTELEKSSQLKSEFLSNTSHELKTPLTSIIANTEILEYEMCGPVNEEQRRVLANIGRNSQHLLDMISRLLDFARHEEGRAAVRYERVDLRTLLDGVVETVQPLLEDGVRRIEVYVDERLEPCYLDGEKIYRVYLNLVENAIKFSRGGEIRVEAEKVGDEIEGRVADQGIGIPPEKLEEVFEAFRQVDASSTRTYQGVGLGLAICKQLVELHGGRIWAESAPGQGSVLRFRLQYRLEPPGGAPAAGARTEAISEGRS